MIRSDTCAARRLAMPASTAIAWRSRVRALTSPNTQIGRPAAIAPAKSIVYSWYGVVHWRNETPWLMESPHFST
jgi:hypothetical protein